MPLFIPAEEDFVNVDVDGVSKRLLKASKYNEFNEKLLGLGDISREAESIDAIAAVFDLEGFTTFCRQIEPHLTVPTFLSRFLSWLMRALKSEMTQKHRDDGTILWSPLPFYAKFMGDGLLVLWDSRSMSHAARRNILVSMKNVLRQYKSIFLKELDAVVADAPPALRCGVARGTVLSVGDAADYVGSCINMAARLQKLPGVTFAFNRRGFDLESGKAAFLDQIVVKRVNIRGIGENELVGVLKAEFVKLTTADKAMFRDVNG